jgi:hypothetical protein
MSAGERFAMLEIDPGFERTRRESLFLVIPWLICCVWSVGYCYLFGYTDHPRQVGEVTNLLPDLTAYDQRGVPTLDPLGWGIPAWAFWGIFIPWMLSILFSIIYALWIMNDAGDDDSSGDGAA